MDDPVPDELVCSVQDREHNKFIFLVLPCLQWALYFWMSWLLRNFLKLSYRRSRLVGIDLVGNHYYEKITTRGRSRRSVKIKEGGPVDRYTQDSIPPEWDCWLRGLQNDPPTIEQLTRRVQEGQILQKKISDIERKDRELRDKEISEGLVAAGPQRTATTGHASAPSYESHKNNVQPKSTGTDFQPASWRASPQQPDKK